MEEDIKVLKQLKGRWRDIGFGDKMCVCSCREQQAIVNILNELERLQKDNEALEYQLKRLHAENNNITRELLSRTNKLNELLEENYKLNRKIIRYTRYLEIKDKKLEELLEYEYTEREQDYIPKQVIRNKIEEIEKEEYEFQSNDYDYIYNKGKHEVLKEILGEEK